MGKKLSPEFPAHIKPVHVGLYLARFERQGSPGEFVKGFAWWNGLRWGVLSRKKESAANSFYRNAHYVRQDKLWRGLAEPPKGAE